MAVAPWRLRLQPASFNGVRFHVEVQNRGSGRRVAMHEFPKKDVPYAEDMGRRFRTFSVMGYVVGPNYEFQRDLLIDQLELETNGILVLPTSNDQKIVLCDRYSITERRQQGGFAEIEMVFVEAGEDPSTLIGADSQSSVNDTVGGVTGSSSQYQDSTNTFMQSTDITGLT